MSSDHTGSTADTIAINQDLLTSLLQASLDAIFITRTDGSVLSANPAACRLFGFSVDEFRRGGRDLVIDPTDHRLADLMLQRRATGAASGRMRMRRKDGTLFETDMSTATVPASDGAPYALIVVRDVTDRLQAERLVEESEERRRFALDAAQIGDWDMDLRTQVARRSLRHDLCFGYAKEVESWSYDIFLEHIHPADRARVNDTYQRALAGAGAYDVEFRAVWPDGSIHWLWSKGRFYFDAAGQPYRASGIVMEVTNRRLAEQAMRLKTRALDAAGDGILIVDAVASDMPIMYVNPAFEKITGYAAAEVIGRNPRFLSNGVRDPAMVRKLREALAEGREVSVELKNYRRDGALWWNALHISPVRDEDGKVTHFVGVQTDISERKRHEEALQFHANHDALTGLPNRHRLHEVLSQLVHRTAMRRDSFAVVYIDLDRFKRFNDTLGHGVGDQILRHTAARLEVSKRDSDTVGRLGGDEFLLLCPSMDRTGVGTFMHRLIDQLRRPIAHHDEEIAITASIGIAMFPQDGREAGELLKKADLAMYAAKSAGRDRFQFFSTAMESSAHEELKIERALRRALIKNEIHLEYQPQFDLATGRLTGIEALARWRHPTLGQVPPSEFIRVAEATGLIGALGDLILRMACRQNAHWIRTGLCDVPMAVNISALQFREAGFLQNIDRLLAETGLPSCRLEIELTESVIMEGIDASIEKLRALRTLGVQLSIDDFGTGYSSLSYLRQFPVSRIKIDQSFIRDLLDNKDSAAITTAIIRLGHSLGFDVLAEGVEQIGQADFLRNLGCNQAQGYLLSRPLAPDAFTSTMARRH